MRLVALPEGDKLFCAASGDVLTKAGSSFTIIIMTENFLVFLLRGNAFAVREAEISSVTPVVQLHHLPLSPACVAGMAIIDDRSTTIIDLGSCLGDRPLAGDLLGSYLLVGSDDRRTGFWVEGSVETESCSADRLLSLPEVVRCDLVETGMLQGSRVVPIINLALLEKRISCGELAIPEPENPFATPGERGEAQGPSRIFYLGNRCFCVCGVETAVLQDPAISLLPYAHRNALGILHHDGEIVPLLPVAERLGIESGGGRSVLIAGKRGNRYGLLISRDDGIVDPARSAKAAMPPLVQSPMLRQALLLEDRIIPSLELDMLAVREEAGAPEQLANRYTPGSRFPERFRKETVEISEIALFGTRHAVPQEEVVDLSPMVPVQPVPLSPSIVLGVVQRDAKILPVLDLAAIFGKRSPIDSTWSLLRLRNGDFDVLVAVEKAFGSRSIDIDIQRQVPIVLPYEVVYGCYLDDGTVRLILNVEALTVYFEETAIRDFMTSLSPAEKKADEERLLQEQQVMPERMVEAEGAPALSRAAEPEEPILSIPSGAPGSPLPQEPLELPQAVAPSERETVTKAPEPRMEQGAVEELESAEEQGRTEQIQSETLKEQELLSAETVRAEQEEREREGEQQAILVAQEQARIEEEEGRIREQAEQERKETEAHKRRLEEQLQEEQERRKEKERQAREKAGEEEATRRSQESAKPIPAKEEEAVSPKAAEGVGDAERKRVPDTTAAASGLPHVRKPEPSRLKSGVAVAAVVLLALVLFALSRGTKTPVLQQPEDRSIKGKTTEQRKEKAKVPEVPLVLPVPKNVKLPEPPVYIVKKGDTLWGIAKRFTGNPLNYPRIAKENSIATPNLIFPGQKIRLTHQ